MLPDTGPDDRIAAGTGHRTQSIPTDRRDWVRQQTRAVAGWLGAAERPATIGLSGMAIGFDLWWAAAILDAGMRLWIAVPFEEQAHRFPAPDRREWERLRALAEHEVVVGNIAGLTEPARGRRVNQLLAARNQLMVHRAHFLVCCWDPTRVEHCGTYHAICMAHRRRIQLPGVHIDPLHQVVTRGLPELAATAGGKRS